MVLANYRVERLRGPLAWRRGSWAYLEHPSDPKAAADVRFARSLLRRIKPRSPR